MTQENCPIGWTIDAYVSHNEALREAEEKFQAERDRRYAEVREEQEKAIKIKEQADRDALDLARQIQTYKDEKANELRAQIERERGTYITRQELQSAVEKMEATIKPLVVFSQQTTGRGLGWREGGNTLVVILSLLTSVGILIATFVIHH